MARYVTWLKSLPGKPVFVAYPTAFDFPFVYWYITEFVGENLFGYSAIDIKTYSMALMRKPYRMCGKRSMPAEWLDAVLGSAKVSKLSLPVIVPVTEFRDIYGVALTNMIGGADPATELKKATAQFAPVLAKSEG